MITKPGSNQLFLTEVIWSATSSYTSDSTTHDEPGLTTNNPCGPITIAASPSILTVNFPPEAMEHIRVIPVSAVIL